MMRKVVLPLLTLVFSALFVIPFVGLWVGKLVFLWLKLLQSWGLTP